MSLTDLNTDTDETPKQFLVRQHREEGNLTRLQLKAGARRLDQLLDEGVDDPLEVVLEELQTGDVSVGAPDPESEEELPNLEDISDEHSSKQKLLELREAGSLSPSETRVASRALDQGKTIEQALVEADADRLLESAPAATGVDFSELTVGELSEALHQDPSLIGQAMEYELYTRSQPRKGALRAMISVEENSEDPRATLIEDLESRLAQLEQADEGEEGEVEDDENAPTTLADVVKMDLDEMEDRVAQINDKNTVLELIRLEIGNKDRQGGKELLVDRAQDLGATMEEIDEALAAMNDAKADNAARNRVDNEELES